MTQPALAAAPLTHVRRMVRPGAVERRVYLHPGDIVVSKVDCTLSTILGSCVGVCLHDPVARLGGLNHYLLPRTPKSGQPSPRFGDVAMRRLIDELERLGAERRRMTAHVVGGACVLSPDSSRVAALGRENAAMALASLAEAAIPVVASDLEGHRGRRVLFTPTTGRVLVTRL